MKEVSIIKTQRWKRRKHDDDDDDDDYDDNDDDGENGNEKANKHENVVTEWINEAVSDELKTLQIFHIPR